MESYKSQRTSYRFRVIETFMDGQTQLNR